MFCKNCGYELEEDDLFCAKCGMEVNKENKVKESKKNPKNKKSKKKKVKRKTKYHNKYKTKKEKTKEKNHYGLVFFLTVIIVLLVMVIGVIGLYMYKKHLELKEPIKEEWGQIYFEYLKEKPFKIDKAYNQKLQFLDVDNIEKPVMIITYNIDDIAYTNLYYIKNNKVKNVKVTSDDIKLLYNISKKDYDYYTYKKANNQDKYQSLYNIINNYNGIYNLSTTTLEKTFIDTKISLKKVNYQDNLDEENLRMLINKAILNYKQQEQLITKKIDDMVLKKTEIEEKVESEEPKQEEKEEENKPVNSYTLDYGDYKTDSENEILSIKENGICNYQNEELNKNENCTYQKNENQLVVKINEETINYQIVANNTLTSNNTTLTLK